MSSSARGSSSTAHPVHRPCHEIGRFAWLASFAFSRRSNNAAFANCGDSLHWSRPRPYFRGPSAGRPRLPHTCSQTHVAGRKLHHHEASDVVAHRTPTKGQLRGTLRGAGARVRATARMSCCDAVGAQIVAREEDGTRVRREMGCGWGIDRREQQRTASFCVAERGPARARRARGKSAQREECGRARKAGGAAHASCAALMWQRFCVCSLPRARFDRSFVRSSSTFDLCRLCPRCQNFLPVTSDQRATHLRCPPTLRRHWPKVAKEGRGAPKL